MFGFLFVCFVSFCFVLFLFVALCLDSLFNFFLYFFIWCVLSVVCGNCTALKAAALLC